MSRAAAGQFDAESMLRILDVSRALSGPFELDGLLMQVIDAGRSVLGAERGSLFLYDTTRRELYSTVATGAAQIRFGVEKGIAGEAARTRRSINVEDCYADPRFNPEVDRATGYRTRCLVAVPLIGLDDELVGVLQLLNPPKLCFDAADLRLAEVLASHAAVAIQRTRLMEERLVKLKLERDLDLARELQDKILPQRLPALPGYDLAVYSKPADQTGGDIYDVVPMTRGPGDPLAAAGALGAREGSARLAAPADGCDTLLLLMADATGHGIGPALSVTQVRAMLRMALRLGSGLDAIIEHLNAQLHEDLGGGRFVTAFLGLLDPRRHVLEYHSAGQGPLLHYRAADGSIDLRNASTYPLGIVGEPPGEMPAPFCFAPGDAVVLLTDGFYEYLDASGRQFGKDRVAEVVRAHHASGAAALLDAMLRALRRFAGDAPQMDDLTAVIVRRV